MSNANLPAASHTLVYISRALIQGDVMRELVLIEAQARGNNAAHGVRGALIYMSGFFMQWLEGPRPALEMLNERLKSDKRHRDYYVLLFEAQPPVLTETWMMCVAKRTETADEVRRRARSVVVRARRGTWNAADLVRALIKPADLATGKREPGPFRYTRVCVVATNSIWPSALVRHVADTAKVSRISRTWLNTPAKPDEAALCEYVDVPLQRGIHMRVSCISGWLVQSPLFDLLNQQTQVLAMLFRSASAADTLAFAQKILATQSMQQTRPAVIGVFPPKATEIAEIFREYAGQQGFDAQVVFSHLAEPTAVWEEVRAAADRFFVEHAWASTSTLPHDSIFAPRTIFDTAGALPAEPPARAQAPAPVAPASARAAPPPVIPAPKSAVPVPVAVAAQTATPPAPARSSAHHAVANALQRVFSSYSGVQSWAAWAQAGMRLIGASAPTATPEELLAALAQLRGKLAPDALLDATTALGQGRFEWIALIAAPDGADKNGADNTGQDNAFWLRVVLQDADLNLGMVQYLAGQWKEALTRAAQDDPVEAAQ